MGCLSGCLMSSSSIQKFCGICSALKCYFDEFVGEKVVSPNYSSTILGPPLEMVGWHHWLSGHAFEQAPGVGDGQGSLVCCSLWGLKELDTTEWLNWTELNLPKNGQNHDGALYDDILHDDVIYSGFQALKQQSVHYPSISEKVMDTCSGWTWSSKLVWGGHLPTQG